MPARYSAEQLPLVCDLLSPRGELVVGAGIWHHAPQPSCLGGGEAGDGGAASEPRARDSARSEGCGMTGVSVVLGQVDVDVR